MSASGGAAEGPRPQRGAHVQEADEVGIPSNSGTGRASSGARRGRRLGVLERARVGHREGGERQRDQAIALGHPRREGRERAPRALHLHGDLGRSLGGRGGEVDGERARGPRGIAERLGERAQDDRVDVAAVRAAPDHQPGRWWRRSARRRAPAPRCRDRTGWARPLTRRRRVGERPPSTWRTFLLLNPRNLRINLVRCRTFICAESSCPKGVRSGGPSAAGGAAGANRRHRAA